MPTYLQNQLKLSKKGETRKRKNFSLSPKVCEMLKFLSEQLGVSQSKVVSSALIRLDKAFMEHKKKKDKRLMQRFREMGGG